MRRTGRALVVSGIHAVGAMQAAVTVHAAGIVSPALEPKQRIASLPNYVAYRCADGRWITFEVAGLSLFDDTRVGAVVIVARWADALRRVARPSNAPARHPADT